MKFASSSAASGRNQMRERQRRDREATPLLRTRYPQFESLRLDFDFRDDGPFTPAPQATVLHPPARAYFIFPCPYADCDGEFDLSGAVDAVAREGAKASDGELKCPGHRNQDRNGRSPCGLVLQYSIGAQVA